MSVIDLLQSINFGPGYGDWSGALVSILFGSISLFLSIISGLIIYYRWKKESKLMRAEQKRLSDVEEQQNYLDLRKRYDEIWDKITENGLKQLYIAYNNKKALKETLDCKDLEKLKTRTWQLINLLSDIEFLYSNNKNCKYWKRWEVIFKFVFSKPFICMAFIKNRDDFNVNSSFVKYVDRILSKEEL